MSIQNEASEQVTVPATKASGSEVEQQLRKELEATKREAAISGFVAQVTQLFPHVPATDLRALVQPHLTFENGALIGEDVALSYLRTRSFLQAPSAAAPGDHRQWAEKQSQVPYLRSVFGKDASGKQAMQLFKADPVQYRRLRSQAIELGVYGK